jgi:hypothetical protein
VTLTSDNQTLANGNFTEEVNVQRIAQVDRCTACGELTLSRYLWIDQYFDPGDVVPDVLYPARRDLTDLPAGVAVRYGAMLELQHAPDVFAVRAGRVLEAVCADRGIDDKLKFREQLNALVDEASVPKPLVDQAHLVYDYRNYGGHTKEFEVETQDVSLIRGFVDSLLEFLYWEPAALARAAAAFKERRTEALGKAPDAT